MTCCVTSSSLIADCIECWICVFQMETYLANADSTPSLVSHIDQVQAVCSCLFILCDSMTSISVMWPNCEEPLCVLPCHHCLYLCVLTVLCLIILQFWPNATRIDKFHCNLNLSTSLLLSENFCAFPARNILHAECVLCLPLSYVT